MGEGGLGKGEGFLDWIFGKYLLGSLGGPQESGSREEEDWILGRNGLRIWAWETHWAVGREGRTGCRERNFLDWRF